MTDWNLVTEIALEKIAMSDKINKINRLRQVAPGVFMSTTRGGEQLKNKKGISIEIPL